MGSCRCDLHAHQFDINHSIVIPFKCYGQDPICVGPCLTCMIRCDSAKEVYDGSLLIGFVAVLLPVKNFSISLDF